MCLLKSGRCGAGKSSLWVRAWQGAKERLRSGRGRRIKVLEGRDGAGSKRETQIRAERGG